MKKTLLIVVSVIMLFSLTSCSLSKKNNVSSDETYYPEYDITESFCIKNENGEELLNADHVESVRLFISRDKPSVLITFTEDGKALFATATAENENKNLDICVGDTVIISPKVVAPITNGEATFLADSLEKAEEMLEKIKK